MKRLLSFVLVLPMGIIMSGPFAIIGTAGGLVIGLTLGFFLGKL